MTALRQYRAAMAVLAAVAVLAFVIQGMQPTQAMPPFAQAYGMNCEVCHSIVPALNAYGRYVQRTGYASLDPTTIHHVDPFWVGEALTYDTQDPDNPHKIVAGNLALHGAGYLGSDMTFHIHQFITDANMPGGTDTLWITYNNLFHRDGHLFIGKIEPPAPSPFSQFMDISGFAPPEIVVGEHAYQLDGNRWGTKLVYARNNFVAESAYLWNSGDLNTATDFSNDTDKTWQWRLAYADPAKPVEAGIYGASGSWPISDGTFDHYTAFAGYVQRDPQNGVPGLLGIYQIANDPNAGAGLGAAHSKAFSVEVYEPFFQNRVMLSARDEVTDDGLGTVSHGGNVDLEIQVLRDVTNRHARALFLNGEAGMANGSPPAWRAGLFYATTFNQ